MAIIAVAAVSCGLLLTLNNTYLHIFLSADKITADTIRFGNTFLYVDYSMYLFLGCVFITRNCVQGIGRSQFVLGAGAAELVARIAVCLVLPAAVAGGAVSAAASRRRFTPCVLRTRWRGSPRTSSWAPPWCGTSCGRITGI